MTGKETDNHIKGIFPSIPGCYNTGILTIRVV